MTHETGHFLGLAHSGEPHATMYASYTPGATAMRNLTSDDIAGICTIYRPDGTRSVLGDKVTQGPQCDHTPRRGFTGACAEPHKKSCWGSAQIAAHTPVSPGWLGTGLGGVVVLAVRACRRRRQTSALPPANLVDEGPSGG